MADPIVPVPGSQTRVDLDTGEVALIIGEEEGTMSVRVIAADDVATEGEELAAAPEIVLALATRLLEDPDFHNEVLDWYYDHLEQQDTATEEEDEG